MYIKIPTGSEVKDKLLKINDQKKGSVLLLDETRLESNAIYECENMMLVEDGIIETRWGRDPYGEAIAAESKFDGAFEYVKDLSKATEERQLIVIGGSGKSYISINNGKLWKVVPGKYFSPNSSYSFVQINEFMYIANGKDPLVRYNGVQLISYTKITKPAAPIATKVGLSGHADTFTSYYRITALNDVGETGVSDAAIIAHDVARSDWTSGKGIKLTWAAVTGANRYQIYYSDENGWEALIGSTAGLEYSDVANSNGEVTSPNLYITSPLDNTTGAPKFKHVILSGNRLWGTNDPENPYRVYFSGVGVNVGRFSGYYGGGWVDIEYGGKEQTIGLADYRSGDGFNVATVMTKGPDGTGSTWQIPLTEITVDQLTFMLPHITKIVSYVGATSYNAIINTGEKIFYPNINGIFTIGNEESIYNVLVSNELSQLIRTDYRKLVEGSLEKMTGIFYQGLIFFSAALTSHDNDMIFIYDVERKAWIFKWSFGVKQFFTVTDSHNNSHMLYVPVNGNQLSEISDDFRDDHGEAFNTDYKSGLLSFNDDMQAFAKIHEVVVELGRLNGEVIVEIRGSTRNGKEVTLATSTFKGKGLSKTDFTNALFSDIVFSDDGLGVTPVIESVSTSKKRVRVNRLMHRLGYRISSTKARTSYSLLGLQAVGRLKAIALPNEWK